MLFCKYKTRCPTDKLLSLCLLLCTHRVFSQLTTNAFGLIIKAIFKSDLSYPRPASVIWLSYFFSMLEMSSPMPSMHSTTELHPQPHGFSFFYSEIWHSMVEKRNISADSGFYLFPTGRRKIPTTVNSKNSLKIRESFLKVFIDLAVILNLIFATFLLTIFKQIFKHCNNFEEKKSTSDTRDTQTLTSSSYIAEVYFK